MLWLFVGRAIRLRHEKRSLLSIPSNLFRQLPATVHHRLNNMLCFSGTQSMSASDMDQPKGVIRKFSFLRKNRTKVRTEVFFFIFYFFFSPLLPFFSLLGRPIILTLKTKKSPHDFSKVCMYLQVFVNQISTKQLVGIWLEVCWRHADF